MGMALGSVSSAAGVVWSLATPVMVQADSNRPNTRVAMVILENRSTRPNVEIIGEL